MRVRSIVAGLATTAVAVSVTGLVTLTPASADPAYGTPDANDLVGVGSDTTENAMDNVANGVTYKGVDVPGYNAGLSAGDVRLASFGTVGSATIVLRQGHTAINRPVGSGAGKALLFGAGNNPDVSFARSSSALNGTESAAGLQMFPFAVDTLGVAVSGNATNAPAKLTGAQIVDIYKGVTTNWNEVGGSNGIIKPYVPQAGSGTRSFFEAQLTALNSGTPVTYGADVDQSMHENTDDVLKNDPNAIAPFSLGKQQTLFPSTVRMESLENANGGWSAQRALYNVVRGTDLADATLGPELNAVFSGTGFMCSPEARPLIEAAGFKQLATAGNGGACGEVTNVAVSNFASNEANVTTTKLKGSSTKPGKITLTATVTGSTGAPSGSVSFFAGNTLLKADVPLTSGQAVATVSGTPGAHSYTADFTGQGLADPSTATKSLFVKAGSSITESYPDSVAKGARANGTITVKLSGVSDKATGTVKVMQGKKTLASGKLAKGKVTIKLPALSKGRHSLTASWGGDTHGIGSTKKFTITQK